MINYKPKARFFRCILLAVFPFAAIHPSKAQSLLDGYIQEGLRSNQSIKQQVFMLEKNVYALKEAKNMFLPDVTFSTAYTKADGGRTINFPTGDLLNGVYATLNQLTGTNSFPQLKNESILLNPDNYYDAKFRTTWPILNAELIYNKRIKLQQMDLQKAEILLYKRELVKEIKTAYYNYLKAINATRIYESVFRLVEEGLRINTSLYNNSKVNHTTVIRSKNEVSKIKASLIAANKTAASARNYFNFLLNRSLTDSILTDDIRELPKQDYLVNNSINGREELSKLKIAKDINASLTGLAKSHLIPKIGTYLDLGSQAFDWQFNTQSRYYFWAISLEWNLFSFGKHSYKVKQTLSERQSINSQTDYVQQQLQMELKVRQNDMQTEIAKYHAAQSQVKTNQTYYNDMLRLYKEGMAIYIELLDAQNQLVDAQLQANIALFDTWIAYTAIERANASFTIQ